MGCIRYVNLIALLFAFNVTTAVAQDYVPGEVIIKYKEKNKKDKLSKSDQSSISNKLIQEKGLSLKNSWSGLKMGHFGLKPGQDVQAAINELQQDPDIEYVEPNYYLQKSTLDQPEQVLSKENFEALYNDYVESGGDQGSQSISYSQTGAPVNIPEAWAQMSGTTETPIVAVIDTGIDLQHVDLQDALWVNSGEVASNGVDDDGNGYVDDVNGWNFVNNNNNPDDCDGHGTHVAGIIRGTTQDILENPLPASKIKLMAVKFLDCSGNGTTSSAVQAIYYAVNKGAKVLNNSWGGGNYSASLHDAIVYSYNAQTSFVAAAGNAGVNNDVQPMYPASYSVPNVIAVSATTDADALASFSNYGASKVHLASPGVGIYSTYLNNLYASLSGTSMATPFVSGVVAIMVREKPTMNGYQLKNISLGAVDLKSSLSGKVQTGGRLNALTALQSAKSATVDPDQPSYSAASSDRALASISSGGGCGTVQQVYDQYSDRQSKMEGTRSPLTNLMIISFLLALPFALALTLKGQPQTRRRWERFQLGSKVYVQSEKMDFMAAVGTISMGGLEVKTDRLLSMDDRLKMIVESPDGSEYIEVEGKVVWCNNGANYGISFVEAKEKSLFTIHQWTKSLAKN